MKKLSASSSVTAARGFRADGIAAGIKPAGKKDLALIVSDVPAAVAAVFTRNQVKAAPVKLDMEHVKSGKARAIVANSGNANACTGSVGLIHAKAMATDAAVPRAPLQRALRAAVNQSFNRISVDGDMSTNDTVICLANGLAGKVSMPAFQEALNFVCLELAKMIVKDGEGVSKFVTINIHNASSDRDAEIAA